MSPNIKYVLVMIFIAVVLAVSLNEADLSLPIAIGIWSFVVFGFGTYLYFRMLRSGPGE